MHILKAYLLFLGILIFPILGQAQDVINLYNPSFEDQRQQSIIVNGWNNCGFINESAPDVQPGSWNVDIQAFEGKTYLGLVTRDNDTWELVSQRLIQPLKKGKCYSFFLYLAQEDFYISSSKLTGRKVNYNAPTVLRIWAGNSVCDKAQLLVETEPINHNYWKQYSFKLEPNSDYNFIILEAFYDVPVLMPTNGNLLIDNLSPLKMIPCEQEELIASPVEPEVVQEVVTPENELEKKDMPAVVKVKEPEEKEEVSMADKDFQPKIIKELDHAHLKEGQVIKIKHLHFKSDSSSITPESIPVLNEIFRFLNAHKDVNIEIGGHTNALPPSFYCKKLSRARAKSVRDYLVEKGIDSTRIAYRGYGKTRPIASNETPQGRLKNQRCEIKIISIDGSE